MIPKIIHYCWFGGKILSPMAENCIATWRKYLPDYEIREWNETNFNVNCCEYAMQAYAAGKWAFVSDVARLYALQQEGGIYLDTDVEVLRPLDRFLGDGMFMGFEANDSLSTAVIGAEAHHPMIEKWLDSYGELSFIRPDGTYDQTPNVDRISGSMRRAGLRPNGREQQVQGVRIYPETVFSPNHLSRIWQHTSSRSCTVHHFDGSWTGKTRDRKSLRRRIGLFLVGALRNTLGTARYTAWKGRIKRG